MKPNDKITREAQLSIDRVHTSLARITWALRTNDLNSVERHIDTAIYELVKLAEIASKGNSSVLAVGDKIEWAVEIKDEDNKNEIIQLTGSVTDINNNQITAIGKCKSTGKWWRDNAIHANYSVKRLHKLNSLVINNK